jgi:hypothetical protein
MNLQEKLGTLFSAQLRASAFCSRATPGASAPLLPSASAPSSGPTPRSRDPTSHPFLFSPRCCRPRPPLLSPRRRHTPLLSSPLLSPRHRRLPSSSLCVGAPASLLLRRHQRCPFSPPQTLHPDPIRCHPLTPHSAVTLGSLLHHRKTPTCARVRRRQRRSGSTARRQQPPPLEDSASARVHCRPWLQVHLARRPRPSPSPVPVLPDPLPPTARLPPTPATNAHQAAACSSARRRHRLPRWSAPSADPSSATANVRGLSAITV